LKLASYYFVSLLKEGISFFAAKSVLQALAGFHVYTQANLVQSLNLWVLSNAFMAFARSLYTFNRSKKDEF